MNGANYYMDVFGKRFQKELEQMKRDVAKWQNSPAAMFSPPTGPIDSDALHMTNKDDSKGVNGHSNHGKRESIDKIPLLDETGSQHNGSTDQAMRTTGAEILNAANEGLLDRKNVLGPISGATM